jgi:hypothetical protein
MTNPKSYRSAFCTSLTACFVSVSLCLATPQKVSETSPPVQVLITASKTVLHAPDWLELHIEIWNRGKEEIFIGKEINGPFSHLKLNLTGPPQPPSKAQGGTNGAVDCMVPPNETFTNLLLQHWVALPPGNFYGTVIQVGPSGLLSPGKYVLNVTYGSPSFKSAFCMNGISLDPNKITELRYKEWSGHVESNSVSIQVLAPRK